MWPGSATARMQGRMLTPVPTSRAGRLGAKRLAVLQHRPRMKEHLLPLGPTRAEHWQRQWHGQAQLLLGGADIQVDASKASTHCGKRLALLCSNGRAHKRTAAIPAASPLNVQSNTCSAAPPKGTGGASRLLPPVEQH